MKPVRLEPAGPRSRFKHSTTEPLRSLRPTKNTAATLKIFQYRKADYEGFKRELSASASASASVQCRAFQRRRTGRESI